MKKKRKPLVAPSFAAIVADYKRMLPPETDRQPLGEGWHAVPARSHPGYKCSWRVHASNGLGAMFEVHDKRLAFFLAAVMNAYERETGRDAYEDFCR